MTVTPLHNPAQRMPAPQGHAIGFVNTQEECDSVTRTLNEAGYSDEKITVLEGKVGVALFRQMMDGTSWGETSDDLLKMGLFEIGHGRLAIIIDVASRDEALFVANLANEKGGCAFSYFGTLVDERLTK